MVNAAYKDDYYRGFITGGFDELLELHEHIKYEKELMIQNKRNCKEKKRQHYKKQKQIARTKRKRQQK